jgi:hypothetical protein
MRFLRGMVLLIGVLVGSPAFAQTPPERTVTIVTAAPVFDAPDTGRQPLRVAKEGSVLLLLDMDRDWCHVQFQDPELGRRNGYVQSRFVRVAQPSAVETSTPSPSASNTPRTADTTPDLIAFPKSYASKFFLGAGYEGNAISLTEPGVPSDTGSGRGIGIIVGYGFNPHASLLVKISGAGLEGGTLSYFDIGTRIHFLAESSRAVPFIELAFSGRALKGDFIYGLSTHTLTATGIGPTFGGGVNVHFTPAVAFSGGVTWTTGSFSDYKVDNVSVPGVPSLSAMSARVHLGLIWFAKAPTD